MKKRAILNFSVSIAYQIINILLGLILPKLYTETFGSVYNGLNQSVSQILSLLSVLQFGISAASIQQMFQYIATDDEEKIAAIYWDTGRQYRRMGYVFLTIIVPIIALSPLLIKDELPSTIIFAFLIMRSVSAAMEYFFQAKYSVIMIAHNLSFVVYIFNILLLLFSTAMHLTVLFTAKNILLYQSVALLSALVRFALVSTYIRHKFPYLKGYKKRKIELQKSTKRKDVLIAEVAGMVINSTDLLVLSSNVGLVSASIYSVYHFVTSGLGNILSGCREAVFAGIGKTYFANFNEFQKKFEKFESIYFFLTFYLYGVAILLFKPFVTVYTANMDAQYVYMGFPVLFILAQMLVNLRIPSIVCINTAGHFSQVKKYAVVEAVINLVLSIALVKPLGIYGVLIGTIAGALYRTPLLVRYADKHIIIRTGKQYLKKMAIWIPTFLACYVFSIICPLQSNSLLGWICMAVLTAGVILILFASWMALVDRATFKELIHTVITIVKRRKST